MLEVQANGFGPCVLSYGGDTFNTSVYLRRCASRQAIEVSYATGLGVDPLSLQLKQAWNGLGLNLSAIQSIDGKLPGMYLIETDDKGERSFHFWRESSAAASCDNWRRGKPSRAASAEISRLCAGSSSISISVRCSISAIALVRTPVPETRNREAAVIQAGGKWPIKAVDCECAGQVGP